MKNSTKIKLNSLNESLSSLTDEKYKDGRLHGDVYVWLLSIVCKDISGSKVKDVVEVCSTRDLARRSRDFFDLRCWPTGSKFLIEKMHILH